MSNLPSLQKGAIPLILVIVIALSALLGGVIGFSLGDGSLFSFGIGFGVVFFIFVIFQPRITEFIKALKESRE